MLVLRGLFEVQQIRRLHEVQVRYVVQGQGRGMVAQLVPLGFAVAIHVVFPLGDASRLYRTESQDPVQVRLQVGLCIVPHALVEVQLIPTWLYLS